MDYDEIMAGVQDDWAPSAWVDDTGTTANNGPQVQANDILTQSTVSQGQDRWTGWLQGLVGDATKYALQRDAAKNGLVPTTSANGQPTYMSAQQAPVVGGVSMGGVLVIGAIVLAIAMAAGKKG